MAKVRIELSQKCDQCGGEVFPPAMMCWHGGSLLSEWCAKCYGVEDALGFGKNRPLLDHFAGLAMAALISSAPESDRVVIAKMLAADAFDMAAAMVAEKRRREAADEG